MAAASLSLRRGTASALFNRLVFNPNPIRSAPAAATAARSFNTDSQVTSYNEDGRAVDVQCSPDRSVTRRPDSVPTFFSDVFDPFSPTRTLSQVLNLMDQLLDDPLLSLSRGRAGGVVGSMRGWDVKEDNEALYLKINMPGLGKENVKVWVEQNTLVIKGEGEKESGKDDDDEFVPRYSSRIDLPPNIYKIDEIKAEMKNGVLKIVVPKVKEGEREDVKQVQVEG